MRTRFTKAISRYVRVAPFPHMTTLSMAGLSLLCGAEAGLASESGNKIIALIFWTLSALFAWGILLCQADALSRFREFKRVRATLRRYGFKPRILHPVSSSRCQRDAALLAACETGFRAQAHRYFREMGYRWYHILPDRIVANPLYFFHPSFLRSTFLPRRTSME
ncbi:hypothetical protein LN040_05105 [Desulfovibrio subterraneus]|uniref:Uncharacterized protein n=1 Tax=Desulfovibrio subterraneus TaxID=2718620 RepID=A0A7J0BN49_9BACT|nr:hypothetical protein [Desulfovibrio subterraneus]WBF68485.1 hypothetical protein LN040_05105 [Desulfovibrio subterraneus]GFM34444.1 hypothetical protein DSM101010T_28090 [Desulfovibrio subterraneus]